MLSTESRRGRRILARIDRGTDLFDGLRDLCRKHHIRCGEVRGIGTLELAELAAFDQAARRWKPARLLSGGGLELLQLHGNISEESGAVSIQAQATLMRDRDAGMEVVGGHLQRAVVYSVELVVETFDDVLLRRAVDPSVGLSRWSEALVEDAPATSAPATATSAPASAIPAASRPTAAPIAPSRPATGSAPVAHAGARPAASSPAGASSPAASPGPGAPPPSATRSTPPTLPPPNPNPIQTTTARPIGSAPSWAEVAASSGFSEPREPEPLEEDVFLNAGDVIMHPRFQRCVVHRVEGNGEFVQVMLRNGRVVRLSLEVLRLTPQGIENGQRVFTATVL